MDSVIVNKIIDYFYKDGKIYYITSDFYGIMTYDTKTGKNSILVSYPESICMDMAFDQMLFVNNKIYLIPCFAKEIYYYDMELNQIDYLRALSSDMSKMPKRKYIRGIIYHNMVYCVSRSPHIIVMIDSRNNNIDMVSLHGLESEDLIFYIDIYDEKLVYPYFDNIIIVFDLKTKSINKINLKMEEKGFITADGDNIIEFVKFDYLGNIWLYNGKGELFCYYYNGDCVKIETPRDFSGQFYDGRNYRTRINGIYILERRLIFTSAAGYSVLIYDMERKVFSEDNRKQIRMADARPNQIIRSRKMDSDKLLLHNYNESVFYVWNQKFGITNEYQLTVPDGEIVKNKLYKDYFRYRTEYHKQDLKNMLELLQIWENEERENMLRCGEKIYNEIEI